MKEWLKRVFTRPKSVGLLSHLSDLSYKYGVVIAIRPKYQDNGLIPFDIIDAYD